jgi:hypothetical protein
MIIPIIFIMSIDMFFEEWSVYTIVPDPTTLWFVQLPFSMLKA